MIGILRRYAPDRVITPETTLDQLGLSSLDRVQLLMELEQQLDSPVDEAAFTAARTVAELERPTARADARLSPSSFLPGTAPGPARLVRRAAQFILLRPLTRYYARITVAGLENLSTSSRR